MIAANLVLLGAIACSFWLGWVARGQIALRRRALPPATKRQLEIARRAAFISPPDTDFDSEETR